MTRPGAATAAIAVMLAVAVVLAVSVLTGCGGSGASTASTPPSAASVAARLGCTGVEQVPPPPELYAYDEVTCTLNGRPVDVVTFRTDTLRDSWIKVASAFSGIEQAGHLYAVADA